MARDSLFALVDRLIRLVPPRGPRRGVAVIMPHGLGDLLLFTPAFQHIRAHFAGEPILLVCSSSARAYVTFYLKPERIIVLDRIRMRRDLRFRMKTLYAVARAGVRVALQPSYNRQYLIEDALMRASGAEQRIGASGSPILITAIERARSDRWYTRIIHEPPGPLHESECYAAFTEALTGSRAARLMPRLERPAPHPRLLGLRYIVLACEASAALKAWPAEDFIETGLALAGQTERAVVLVGEVARPSPVAPPGMIDLRGTTSLQGLIAILAHADLVLCNDSAPVHLAAALDVPVVAVAGGGIPGRYLPYPPSDAHTIPPVLVTVDPELPCFGCGWHCRYSVPANTPVPCVAEVPVDRVLTAARGLLQSHSRTQATAGANYAHEVGLTTPGE
jgi:ADP-heptose:LPS heptosyltransferase